jgi:hypothetical protein
LQFHPGVGVGLGHDYTLYALKEGIVSFKQSKYINSVSYCQLTYISSKQSTELVFWCFLLYTHSRKLVVLVAHFDNLQACACFCTNLPLQLQVSVLDVEAYQVPEGNQLKEGSRKSRHREMYTPRAEQRRQQNKAAAAVPV